jgi:hypothetical protein
MTRTCRDAQTHSGSAKVVTAGARQADVPDQSPGDGRIYGEFVSLQLDDQRSLKDSLESRAAGVITSSGVLVTLLFGFAAITTNTKGYRLPGTAHIPLLVALGAFVLAFALAVVVGIPFVYNRVAPAALYEHVRDNWFEPEWVARRNLAVTEIGQVRGYIRSNRIKAWILAVAGLAQLVALLSLAVSVGLILKSY